MGKEIANVDAGQYLVLAQDVDEIKAVVEANIGGGEDVSAFDLEAIKVPTGGAQQWQMPDGTATPEFGGIIAAWQDVRGYWPGAFSGGMPPQCSAPDGRTGHGDPGGDCRSCTLAEWGTGINDKGEPTPGQACKAMRRLFVLRPGKFLPQLLTLPPTSIRPCRKYFVSLVPTLFCQVVTSFGLTPDKSAGGIKYATATFTRGADLSGEEAERVKGYAVAMSRFFAAPVSADEYAAAPEGGVHL